jgi:ribose transport system ATP-binding protein
MVYPNGTVALSRVNLSVESGSVHGLVGANGAGKSTLLKIISGAISPTEGRILWQGKHVSWNGPGDAISAGISCVYQHTPLVPTMSVIDNIFLSHRNNFFWAPDSQLKAFEELCELTGYWIDPWAYINELDLGERQMVAIFQAMSTRPKLLILDEATASLSIKERSLIHRTIHNVVSSGGTAVLFVSHLLDEVKDISDSITVLRDGQVVLSGSNSEIDETKLIAAIVGEQPNVNLVDNLFTSNSNQSQEVALEVKNLRSPNNVDNVSLTIHQGEIVGLAGLLGSGRSEILHAIFGSDRQAHGIASVYGRRVHRTPRSMISAGVVLIPEDRNKAGLISTWEIWRNISLGFISEYARFGLFLDSDTEIRLAQEKIAQLAIKAQSVDTHVDELSGGNAQKVLIAKWLDDKARVLLMDEPTIGVDIGTKKEIQRLIRRLASRGKAILLVDSELDELLKLADRILVVRHGRIVAERISAQTSVEELVSLASGL